MLVIPVIDIKKGLVVHAKHGQRAEYALIYSQLTQNANIEAVLAAYLKLYPFKIFYLADLDAIADNRPQQTLIAPLLAAYPELTFWIDSGYQAKPDVYQSYLNYYPVLGSEAYSAAELAALKRFDKKFILSLDFSGDTPLGARQLFQHSEWWPKDIIIMTLHRVGGLQGPDFEKLQTFSTQFPQHRFIAAGGIRNIEDLQTLQSINVNTALVASALHSGAIESVSLQTLLPN